ncbi:hypothetical protein LIA77_05788 [Sarocladium implicatum]|nr:hypothetical protein LIA77_05788 [Sarocladium implicatum]
MYPKSEGDDENRIGGSQGWLAEQSSPLTVIVTTRKGKDSSGKGIEKQARRDGRGRDSAGGSGFARWINACRLAPTAPDCRSAMAEITVSTVAGAYSLRLASRCQRSGQDGCCRYTGTAGPSRGVRSTADSTITDQSPGLQGLQGIKAEPRVLSRHCQY